MKKLKIILQSNRFYIILLFLLIIYIIISTLVIKYESKLDEDSNTFKGKIIDFDINGDILKINLKTKNENIICFYQIKTEEEKEDLLNNLEYGMELLLVGKLEEPSNNTIPGNFNYKKYLYNKNIFYTLNIETYKIINKGKTIYKIKNKIHKYIDSIDKTGYIKALVLGNKENLDENIVSVYNENGVSHLFAISGMHIGVFSFSINLILNKFIKNKKNCLIMTNIFLIFYGFMIGFPSSIKRALALTTFLTINKVFEINISSLKTLILSISYLLILNPFLVYDVGFEFSTLTTLGIIINANKFKGNILKKTLLVSLIANIYSLPITFYHFRIYNIFSIIQNIFYVPIISYIIYPFSLLSIILPFLSNILIYLTNILESISLFLNKYLVYNIIISFNIYEVFIYYLILFICLFKNLYILLIFELLLVYFKPILDPNNYIYYIDVGQGDSILIVTAYQKEVILIDTGGKVKYDKEKWQERNTTSLSDKIINLLYSKEIRKIDYLILTHGDYDHMGEAIDLVSKFKVDNVIFNNDNYNKLEQELISILENKKIKYYKEQKGINDNLLFLNTKEYDNENDNSNIIYFTFDNLKFLFMADASINKEKDILEKYNLSNIDFIKIGHHGSNTSSSSYFIDKIKPKNCIISVGKNNRYGHPKESVLNTLVSYCNIYRTDQNGSIEIKINKNNYKIKTYNS